MILGPAAVYTDDELQAILDQIIPPRRRRKSPSSIRNYALVVLLARTGLRCSEALDLEYRDLYTVAPIPHLRVRDGKGHKARTVGLHQDAIDALERWFEIRLELPGEHVFCTISEHSSGQRLDDGYVRAMILRKGRAAGIRRPHPHAFRATLAVNLVNEGQPLPIIRDVLGHSNLSITDAYLRRTFPDAAVAALVARD